MSLSQPQARNPDREIPMTPANLATGLVQLFQAQANQDSESTLILAVIQRGLLDAAGVNDTSQKMPPRTQQEAIDFLTGRNGRLCACLCDLEPSWYLKHVKTFLRLTARTSKEPHVPRQT